MGRVNLQQLPKSPGYLECLCARPGHKLVQLDFTALEPVVLTSASKDKALWSIYGGDNVNDAYLFTAAHIRGLGDNINKYYDPLNPSVKSIREAKRRCKKDRGVAKIVHLAATYNAGWRKIHETLNLAGYKLSEAEVQQIYNDYWKLYKGVRRFGQELLQEWRRNGGYIYDGFGLPTTVAETLTKDLVNRYCQKTGHHILELFLAKITQLRTERGLCEVAWPWISDFHDETIWECREEDTEVVSTVFTDALAWLNTKRLTEIEFKGDVLICDNLSQIKCSED